MKVTKVVTNFEDIEITPKILKKIN